MLECIVLTLELMYNSLIKSKERASYRHVTNVIVVMAGGLLFTNNVLLHKNSQGSASGVVVEESKIPHSSNCAEA